MWQSLIEIKHYPISLCVLLQCKCTTLWRLVMYFAYIFVWVNQMIIQQWHALTTRHTRISFLLVSRRLSRPRVASRYSVQRLCHIHCKLSLSHCQVLIYNLVCATRCFPMASCYNTFQLLSVDGAYRFHWSHREEESLKHRGKNDKQNQKRMQMMDAESESETERVKRMTLRKGMLESLKMRVMRKGMMKNLKMGVMTERLRKWIISKSCKSWMSNCGVLTSSWTCTWHDSY